MNDSPRVRVRNILRGVVFGSVILFTILVYLSQGWMPLL